MVEQEFVEELERRLRKDETMALILLLITNT